MKRHFIFCPYAGFKLRIYSSSFIRSVLLNTEQYNLVALEPVFYRPNPNPTIGHYVDKVCDSIFGNHQGFFIKIGLPCKGRAVEKFKQFIQINPLSHSGVTVKKLCSYILHLNPPHGILLWNKFQEDLRRLYALNSILTVAPAI